MCVSRTVEKDERVLALRMSFGRAFQREGAAAAKALMERHRKHKHRVLIGRKCVCVCVCSGVVLAHGCGNPLQRSLSRHASTCLAGALILWFV